MLFQINFVLFCSQKLQSNITAQGVSFADLVKLANVIAETTSDKKALQTAHELQDNHHSLLNNLKV